MPEVTHPAVERECMPTAVTCNCKIDRGTDEIGRCRNCGASKLVYTELHPAEPIKREAVKTQEGKTRFDLLPVDVLRGVADVMALGAKKNGRVEWDWLHGKAWSAYYGAALRHVLAFGEGRDDDDDSGLLHLDHAIASLMILSTYYKRNIGRDDIGTRNQKRNL